MTPCAGANSGISQFSLNNIIVLLLQLKLQLIFPVLLNPSANKVQSNLDYPDSSGPQ